MTVHIVGSHCWASVLGRCKRTPVRGAGVYTLSLDEAVPRWGRWSRRGGDEKVEGEIGK